MARTRTLSGVVTAAIVIAGCGASQPFPGGSASGSRIEVAAPAVLSALDETTAQESARMSMRAQMHGLPGDEEMLTTAEGVMTLDGAAFDLDGRVEAAGESYGMKMRLVDGAMYMRASGVPNAPDGWMKVPVPEVGLTPGSAFGSTADPTGVLDMLRGVSGTVQQVGIEEVRGAVTTHYFLLLDLAQAAESEDVPPEVRKELQDQLATLGIAMPAIPTDVWIDDDGRLRKMEMVMDFGDLMGGFLGEGDAPSMSMTMSVELYDFGVAVDVEPPPADEIVPLDEALLEGATA
jgi:hypothetical protein